MKTKNLLFITFLLIVIFSFQNCQPEWDEIYPIVRTGKFLNQNTSVEVIIEQIGSSDLSEVGIEINTNFSSSEKFVQKFDSEGSGNFDVPHTIEIPVHGYLKPNTTYYARAYAQNIKAIEESSGIIQYGEQIEIRLTKLYPQLSTGDILQKISCTDQTITYLWQSTLTNRGDKDCFIIEGGGIIVSEIAPPTLDNYFDKTVHIGFLEQELLVDTLKNLQVGKNYFVRMYATVLTDDFGNTETAYGETVEIDF